MILDTKKESELIGMLPNVKEVPTIQLSEEELTKITETEEFNIGDILYSREEDAMIQYMLLDWEKDQSVIMEGYEHLLPGLFKNNEEVTPTMFVDAFTIFKEKAAKIMETCESNNIGFYLKQLQDEEAREDITEKELIEVKRKQKAIAQSVNFFYIKDMPKMKYDKKEYTKYKQLARKKMKSNSKYSFVSASDNELHRILDEVHPSKKNKLFLMYFYKFIADSKMSMYNSLIIHFSLVNILDLNNPNNKMSEFFTNKLATIIDEL